MKLTKLQRHTAYIIMLAEAEKNLDQLISAADGLCHVWFRITGLFNIGSVCFYHRVIEDYLPELWDKRNKDVSPLSRNWPYPDKEGWQKRIELLKQCIEETA